MSVLKIYCENEECRPVRAHPTDAGIDLKAKEEYVVGINAEKIKTGVHVEIPEGYVGLVALRSGLSLEGMYLANGVGVIDSDYRGEIMCAVRYNTLAYGKKRIKQYERIAQLVVVPCLLAEEFVENLEDLSDTERGEGGFGHTGKH